MFDDVQYIIAVAAPTMAALTMAAAAMTVILLPYFF